MENPKITILLATFNRAHLLEDTLNSILAQTYRNWECVIVDDHSRDNTFEVIEAYIKKDARFSYFLKTENYKKGLSGSRNYGLDIAKQRNAQFIQFFDDDDLMHPKKLELQIEPLIIDSQLHLTICCYRKFIRKETIEFDLEKANDGSCEIETLNLLKSLFFYQINLNSIGPLWRAKLLLNYRFNEDLHYGEERDLYLRIFLKENVIYKPINHILFWYRKHPDAITSNLYLDKDRKEHSMQLFHLMFLEEVLVHNQAPDFILKSLIKTFIKTRNEKALEKIRIYLKTGSRWMNIRYFGLLLYINFKLKNIF